jgi:hypothetical protein
MPTCKKKSDLYVEYIKNSYNKTRKVTAELKPSIEAKIYIRDNV